MGGPIRQTRDVQLALAFARGDTARAWYQTVELNAKGERSRESLRMPGRGMRNGFTLLVTPSGRVRTLGVPTYPPPLDVEFDSNFAEQFVDFLPVLPPAPLRPGLEWTDADTANPGRGRFTRSTRYRVLRDTTVQGRRAVIVETEARVTLRRVAVIDEEMSIHTELEGTERGRFLFAPQPGLLLRRERTGSLRGTETFILDGAISRSDRQTREYTRVTELLSDPRE